MKKHGDIVTEEGFVLKFHDRPSSEVTISIPDDVIEILEKVAAKRDISIPTLIRLYFGHGMRADLSESFPEFARELFERRFRNRKKTNLNHDEVDLAA